MYAVIHEGHPAWRTVTCMPHPPGIPWEEVELEHPELLRLCAENPGVPLGLTFDGGIAVTATDYALAERRWADRPSPWVVRWADLLQSPVLDLACGRGRHARYLAGRGLEVVAVDREPHVQPAQDSPGGGRVEVVQLDLETGDLGPLQERSFGGVVVTNYLHRPLFPWLRGALLPGGVVIYETFMSGLRNPDFMLESGELTRAFPSPFEILAWEEDGVLQRLCARRA